MDVTKINNNEIWKLFPDREKLLVLKETLEKQSIYKFSSLINWLLMAC